jgi:hypothetical protein
MPHFFISYRRMDQEGRYLAHMVFRELRGLYGEHSVFLDVDSLSPGLSFPAKVGRALDRTDVVLVMIGPDWMRLLNERLSESTDWVRYEVAQSLARTWLPVVPVCCAGVQVPRVHELPDDLRDLGWRDGITLDPFQDFDSHLHRFLVNIERVLEGLREEKEQLRALRAQLATLMARRRECALESLLASLAARLARLEGAIAPAPASAMRRRSRGSITFAPPTVDSPDDQPVSAEHEAMVRRFAVEFNKAITIWEACLYVIAGAFGAWRWVETGDFRVGLGSWLFALLLGSAVGAILKKVFSRRLKHLTGWRNLSRAQREDLAVRLKDLKSPATSKDAVRRVIIDLEK